MVTYGQLITLQNLTDSAGNGSFVQDIMTATMSQSVAPIGTDLYQIDAQRLDPPQNIVVKDEPSPPSVSNGHVDAEKLPFQIIQSCTYNPKATGSSDQEALGCECSEEWGMEQKLINLFRLREP